MTKIDNSPAQEAPPISTLAAILTLLVFIGTALAAAWALLTLLPGVSESLLGDKPKAYWYLSRASAFVLLWMSMLSGVLISNKLARRAGCL